ncbi:hypothetical protein [Rhodovulum sulfidophilum]|uniref:Uncharacterized protein n=1 Tax=Rhodovulum sulfidophilum TaxID=35806 RepID=A0ABS1RQ18_RHOSU|nr:hypothetical protein [Rhodovulum sulfidophilum]MBL3607993.1 hypothetical protein [Rhodovulum sulfidophilum]MCE8455360.1 hypothetical protein [Rhodovulum sulfidophilum]
MANRLTKTGSPRTARFRNPHPISVGQCPVFVADSVDGNLRILEEAVGLAAARSQVHPVGGRVKHDTAAAFLEARAAPAMTSEPLSLPIPGMAIEVSFGMPSAVRQVAAISAPPSSV